MSDTKQTAPQADPETLRAEGDVITREADAPQLSVEEVTDRAAARGGAAEPMAAPPSEAREDMLAEEGIAAWHNSKKITAMWSNASNRNAFAAVEGMGWKRIHNASPSAFLSLVAMLSHAEAVGATCRLRIDGDNQIHEAYVW